MIGEPALVVECDECTVETDPLPLCSLAGGGWDERHIKATLEKMGWFVERDRTVCEECYAKLLEEDELLNDNEKY